MKLQTNSIRKYLFATIFSASLFSVFAHEYILIADKYRVARGGILDVHLFVADGFNIQMERPMQTTITKKFELITGDSTVDLLEVTNNGLLPVIDMKTDFEGDILCISKYSNFGSKFLSRLYMVFVWCSLYIFVKRIYSCCSRCVYRIDN